MIKKLISLSKCLTLYRIWNCWSVHSKIRYQYRGFIRGFCWGRWRIWFTEGSQLYLIILKNIRHVHECSPYECLLPLWNSKSLEKVSASVNAAGSTETNTLDANMNSTLTSNTNSNALRETSSQSKSTMTDTTTISAKVSFNEKTWNFEQKMSN